MRIKNIIGSAGISAFSIKKLDSDVVYFAGGSVWKSIVQIITNFYVLTLIQPEEMGIWNSIILFQTYSVFVQVGVINGFNREFPYEMGRGNSTDATKLAETAQCFTLFSILLVMITGIIVFFILNSSSHLLNISLLVIVLLSGMRFYEQYLASTFRSNQSFKKLGKIYFARGLLGLLTLPLVIYYLYQGYLIRILLATGLTVFLMHMIRPVKVRIRFSKKHFLIMLKYGIYIFSLSYIFTSSETLDRVSLLKFMGHEYVGYYSVAFMAYNAFRMIPVTIANYIYPKLSLAVGKDEDKKNLWAKAFHTNIVMLLILLPLAFSGLLIIPYIISNFFPMYEMGISATQIILFAGVFSGASIGVNLLWSMKAWRKMAIAQLGGALLNAVFILLGIKLIKDPLVGVSTGVLVSQFLYFLLTNILNFRATHR